MKYEICLVGLFNSFILVIILKTFEFTSSVLFATHILLDKSVILLQLPLHLSKLTMDG